jgi:hypothetical protein
MILILCHNYLYFLIYNWSNLDILKHYNVLKLYSFEEGGSSKNNVSRKTQNARLSKLQFDFRQKQSEPIHLKRGLHFSLKKVCMLLHYTTTLLRT